MHTNLKLRRQGTVGERREAPHKPKARLYGVPHNGLTHCWAQGANGPTAAQRSGSQRQNAKDPIDKCAKEHRLVTIQEAQMVRQPRRQRPQDSGTQYPVPVREPAVPHLGATTTCDARVEKRDGGAHRLFLNLQGGTAN